MFTWGLAATLQAFTYNFAGMMTLRFILGLAEAGFFPGMVFYLSFGIDDKNLDSGALSGAFGGLTAYYLAQTTIPYIQGWRAILFWEGVPSILLSIFTWYSS
ncbi:hypothetical protein HDU76_003525 [Blyttiomyces sp. JEL0837]|nr:hypothetical protein HDU76_003525 [Blyttiomyces sp. JEL0837]